MEELEGCHKQQQGDMTEEVKQEMAQFQKKVLMESVSHNTSQISEITKRVGHSRSTARTSYNSTVKPLIRTPSCYPGTSLNRAADSLYFMLILQKLWAVQWVWPIIAYVFILYSEIRTNLSYGHPLIIIPRRPDKRGLTVWDKFIPALIRLTSLIYSTEF